MLKTAAGKVAYKKPWWKSNAAIAVHVVAVYVGVSLYMNSLVKKEQAKRDLEYAKADGVVQSDDEKPLALAEPKSVTNVDVQPTIWSNAAKFDQLANIYDCEINWEERWMGLSLMRRHLVRQARGDVVEVSSGTGRNISYYPEASTGKLNSLTFVDASREMLEVSIKKMDADARRFRVDRDRPDSEIPNRFLHMDAADLAHEVADDTYDTVVETFGLCSVGPTFGPDCKHEANSDPAHPVTILNELARICRPDGKVLLLEHGKSHYKWLNEMMDRKAKSHFLRWGCWPNRDIEALVRQSDLEIEYISRWHFGTTFYIVARPKSIAKSDHAGSLQ